MMARWQLQLSLGLAALYFVFDLSSAQSCQCSSLFNCVNKKKDSGKSERQQCRDSCAQKSGLSDSMKSALEQCKKGGGERQERRQKRVELRQCIWRESQICTGTIPSTFRVKRQAGGQGGRRGGKGRGLSKGLGSENFAKLPKELQDYAQCIKDECKRGGGRRRNGNNGNGNEAERGNDGRRRGGGRRGKGKGGKLVKQCAQETAGCENLDRSKVRDAKRQCREQLGFERRGGKGRAGGGRRGNRGENGKNEDRGARREERQQRRKEKCECLESQINVGLDCSNLPQGGGRGRNQNREVRQVDPSEYNDNNTGEEDDCPTDVPYEDLPDADDDGIADCEDDEEDDDDL